jgi:hypothetical protein
MSPLLRFGRAVLDAAPEPKEGWFAPEAAAGSAPSSPSLSAGRGG